MVMQRAVATCANASTVVVGATELDAIAYDGGCNARNLKVTRLTATDRSLNLSNLDVDVVRSYPRVYTM